MKKNNRFAVRACSIVTAGGMLLGNGAALAANSDITGHWAEATLQAFINKGYLAGYGDGIYKPDNTITRAEFSAIANEVKQYTEGSANIARYTDVSEKDWFYADLSAALKAGYMKGTTATTMEPNKNLTRAEGFTMVANMLGLECNGTRADLKGFADAADVPEWAVPYVGALVREGLIAGYQAADGSVTIQTGNSMTRAEAIVMLNKCLMGDPDELVYVSMNIPYADFYAAEINNTDAVDAVSSATNAKSIKNGEGELNEGTYNDYNADTWVAGESRVNIKGVTYPVAVCRGDLAKLPQAQSAQSDYYYTMLDSAPAVYKTLTVDGDKLTFGKAECEAQKLETGVSISTNSAWGDYQLEIDTDAFDNAKVYGVVLSAEKDGVTTAYGMRHQENIWRKTEIAWSSGIKTTEPHGNTLNSEHYVGLMGSTIQSVTYYTDAGVYTIDCNAYVAKKFVSTLAVENAPADSGRTAVSMEDFPEDYDKQYVVTNAKGETVEGFACDGQSVSWTGTPTVGQYTLTVSDQSGVYAPVSTSFVLTSDAVVAAYDAQNIQLIRAEDAAEDDFSNYLANIASVTVGETSYNASGKRSVKIINDDGTINLEAKSGETAIFEAGKTYSVEVTATGYTKNLSFTLSVPGGEQTLTGTATTEPDEFHDFDAYDITIDVVVENDVVKSIALNTGCKIDDENLTYFNKAMNGRGSKAGIAAQLTGKSVSELSSVECDAVSTATCSSNAIVKAVQNAVKGE